MNGKTRFALIAATAFLAACGDATVAPSANTSTSTIPGGGASAALTSWDTLRFSFVIDPARSITYPLGQGNSIVFPAGSLCDPATSSYGAGTWDTPCAIASQPLTVNAKAWLDQGGHPRIDFDQHVRFAPSSDPAKWVVLTFTDYRSSFLAFANIGYCVSTTSGCVNEATADPTLATVTNPVTGQVTRRIKHFSGYNVFSGFADTVDGASSLLNRGTGPASMTRGEGRSVGDTNGDDRQGYMLAWGRSGDGQ